MTVMFDLIVQLTQLMKFYAIHISDWCFSKYPKVVSKLQTLGKAQSRTMIIGVMVMYITFIFDASSLLANSCQHLSKRFRNWLKDQLQCEISLQFFSLKIWGKLQPLWNVWKCDSKLKSKLKILTLNLMILDFALLSYDCLNI